MRDVTQGITMRTAAWLVVALLTAPAFAVATGHIVGPDGAPVTGAEICEFVEGAPEHCVKVDAHGQYRMDEPKKRWLLVRASGFVSMMIEPIPIDTPLKLERAASLLVTVVDARTSQPIPSGRVMLDSPSGRRIGEFVPFNKLGVRISTLEPGVVFVRAEADGYKPAGPVPVTLVSGTEGTVKVTMTKAPDAPH
jgi:hypothetical protein